MRHLIFQLSISLFLVSCGQTDHRQTELDQDKKEPAISEKQPNADSAREAVSHDVSKHSDLGLFWTDFQNAAGKKDYKKISELTYFPFLKQNNYISAEEFKEFAFDNNNIQAILKAKLPAIGSMSFGGGYDSEGEPVKVKFAEGSIYELNIGGPAIYFSKVNGEFKFIAISYGE